MKTFTDIHPITELLRCFRGRRRELALPKQIDESACLDVFEQVGSEDLTRWQKVETITHAAETEDREALRLMDAAQKSDSEGGCFITPKETAAIRRLVARSAERDHDASELAKVGNA